MQNISEILTKEWIEVQDGDATQEPKPLKRPGRARIADLDTSHPAMASAVKAAYDWAERKRQGYEDASLVLSGPYGTGKTHIARAILWSIILEPEGHPEAAVPAGRFFLANDLLMRMTPTKEKETGMIMTPRASDLVGNAPIVVIDDVGGQQILPYVAAADQDDERSARYFRFIDHCYVTQVSVIITTNLSMGGGFRSEFAEHIGGRAWDRLNEMAPAGFMVGLDGVPSWRVKKGGR